MSQQIPSLDSLINFVNEHYKTNELLSPVYQAYSPKKARASLFTKKEEVVNNPVNF